MIEETSSDLNPPIQVTLHHGRLKLSSPNAIYSYEDLYKSFASAFDLLEIGKRSIERVLLLGLGIGSIPVMLTKKYGFSAQYTAVDFDPEVIKLAGKYLPAYLDSHLDIICMDALDYVAQSNETFDLIAIDLFLDDVVPEKFDAEEFIYSISKLIRPGGIVMFSRMIRNPDHLQRTKNYYEQIFSKIFTNTKVFKLRDNWVLVHEMN